ncbi:MAG: hypothetical protein HQM12_16100 [SAR324 cluster bacterium]|nr:hypothetical protein [SAR324 cluster bacterium]
MILEIRRLLLEDGKELVLLVEDFRALTGIQETLLMILIQEGIVGGTKQYATMRSVIAITDGYLANQNTIATRAQREWIVESQLSNEEAVFKRSIALVASYLNAARWGQSRLEEFYSNLVHGKATQTDWLKIYSEELDEKHRNQLASFGEEKQIPLFPYNDHAIQYLTRKALTLGGRLIFNPRKVINEVMRNILLQGYYAYENNRFPSSGLAEAHPAADIAGVLTKYNDQERNRYQLLFVIWGNNPQAIKDLHRIHSNVFDTFGLKQPDVPDNGKKKDEKNGTKEPEEDVDPNDDINLFKEELESWATVKEMILQLNANGLRKAIVDGLKGRIDWNRESLIKIDLKPNNISICNALGEGNIKKIVDVVHDPNDPDGRLRKEFLALYRYVEIYKRDPSYEEYEEDQVWIANLLDRLAPQVIRYAKETTRLMFQARISALKTNSSILGMTLSSKKPVEMNQFLFKKIEPFSLPILPHSVPQSFTNWCERQNSAYSIRNHLQELVLEGCGCFQGSGNKAWGVDIIRLVADYPEDSCVLDSNLLNQMTTDKNTKEQLTNFRDIQIQNLIKNVKSDLEKIDSLLKEHLGDPFDKHAIFESISNLAKLIKEYGRWSEQQIGMNYNSFITLCKDFQNSALKESLEHWKKLQSLETSQLNQQALSVLGKLSFAPLLIAQQFVNVSSKLISSLQAWITMQQQQLKGINPNQQVDNVTRLFETLMDNLHKLNNQEA